MQTHTCIDCGVPKSSNGIRCNKCAARLRGLAMLKPLKHCLDCQKPISRSAVRCPHCRAVHNFTLKSWREKHPELEAKRIEKVKAAMARRRIIRCCPDCGKDKGTHAATGRCGRCRYEYLRKTRTGIPLPKETVRKMSAASKLAWRRGKKKGIMSPETQRIVSEKTSKRMLNLPPERVGINHVTAKGFRFRNPDNRVFYGKNIAEFVRANPHLFIPEDVIWRSQKKKRITAPKTCRAVNGLLSLRPNRKHPRGSWKGWTWISDTEREKV